MRYEESSLLLYRPNVLGLFASGDGAWCHDREMVKFIMADIHDMSGTLLEKGNDGISVAEQIKRLRQVAKYLKREVPAVGSLVTLTRELLYRGPLTKTELPMVVLNVLPENVVDGENVRVGYIVLDPEHGPFVHWRWIEHWCLEPYVKGQ